MAVTNQGKKAKRVADRRAVFNLRRKRTMKDVIRETRELASTNKVEAQKKLSVAYQAIDKALKRGVIKKNTASRKKSRLAKFIKKSA